MNTTKIAILCCLLVSGLLTLCGCGKKADSNVVAVDPTTTDLIVYYPFSAAPAPHYPNVGGSGPDAVPDGVTWVSADAGGNGKAASAVISLDGVDDWLEADGAHAAFDFNDEITVAA